VGSKGLARGSYVLVLALLALGVSAPGGAGAQTEGSWQAAPQAVVKAVTTISPSVSNTVGLQPSVTAPVVLQSQPALAFGKKPGVLYVSSEPCPLCAAERWAFIAATSRFGKWSKLGTAQSASDDVDPNTQSFTFAQASFSSPYINVKTKEVLGSRQLADGSFAPLQQLTTHEKALLDQYDVAEYFPDNAGTLPFLDFGNKFVVAGPSYDPAVLAGLSREQIAADLKDATKPTTKAVVGAANYLTAAICAIDGQRPASVCKSAGVTKVARFADVGPQLGGACAAPPKKQPVCAATGSSSKG
jgi:hypothetical protein